MTDVVHLDGRGLMRGGANDSSSRYLAMALASRRLMNHLDGFTVSGVPSDSMIEALKDLLTIMDTGWQTSNSFAPVPGQSPFGRYEQALVVNEVAGPLDPQAVRGKLECIVNGSIKEDVRTSVVRDVNDFLYDVENRALHKYSESSIQREW